MVLDNGRQWSKVQSDDVLHDLIM